MCAALPVSAHHVMMAAKSPRLRLVAHALRAGSLTWAMRFNRAIASFFGVLERAITNNMMARGEQPVGCRG